MRRLAVALLFAASTATAQDIQPAPGRWPADSLGNHRAVVHVSGASDVAWARIPWRRRDDTPGRKELIVVNARTGKRVGNVVRAAITREFADIIFQASAVGDYYVYYLPYTGTVSSNYPKISYPPPSATADGSWLARNQLGDSARACASLTRLPRATFLRFEAVDEFSAFTPMERIATEAETRALLARHANAGFLVFPEDRRFAIRMTDDLPQRWTTRGAGGTFAGSAKRGEFYVFQLGVYAARRPLRDVRVTFDGLSIATGQNAPRCFNLGGTDWESRRFTTTVNVDSGKVQALWCGVQVPVTAKAGTYTGTAHIGATGERATDIALRLTVLPDTIRHAGDDEPWRLSRLRWLDSKLAVDDELVRPYTPVTVRGDTVGVLGRELVVGRDGLPAAVRSFFDIEMTRLTATPRSVLTGPIALVAEGADGRGLAWAPEGTRFTKRADGVAEWQATNRAGSLTMTLTGRAEFDGHVQFSVALQADDSLPLRDVRLEIPIAKDVARYAMGLGLKGGRRPASYDWQWNVRKNQDAAWIGDVNAGVQFSLRDDRYRRPLNTNFYQSQPLVMPASWENGGRGGCRFAERDAETYLVTCYSGPRVMRRGETQHYDFILLLTPFHTLDTAAQWTTRYFHAYAPLDSIARMGANTINVHHATPINPWINYPFLTPDTMRAYVNAAHARGFKVKLYYTVRELTDHAPELFALKSLNHEVFSPGPGGGFSWLQEHLGGDYIPAWHVPEIKDAAIINTGISRWHNFYVEGLHWLVENVGIDGLYIDDVAFDRTTMKRVRKVLDRGRPGALIDLHSANQYNERDGFVNSANLYLEHFPYINRLWFGEYFDYKAAPDYWMVEVSGLPFGLMGEMLQDGGNPWRGMVFGMTSRLPWSGDPRPLWKEWDDFGIQRSRMIGWWVPSNPVRTGRDDVLATAYVRDGRALVALASWAPERVSITPRIDWRALGIDSARARITARPMRAFQDSASFVPGEAIPVEPGKGWLLRIEPRGGTE